MEPQRGAEPVAVLSLAHLFGGVKEPQSLAYWFYRIDIYATLLWQTVQMAILATVMGFAVAFVLSFPAARNLARHALVLWVMRRAMEVMRSMPQVVLAFILVWPFGIGPLAGILAIGIHSTGALGKLFSELTKTPICARSRACAPPAETGWLRALRHRAAGACLVSQLRSAAVRDQCAVLHHHRLRRRRRHRPGIQAGDRLQHL